MQEAKLCCSELAFQVPQGILKLLDAHPELSDKSAGDT